MSDELVVAHMTESAEIGGEHHEGHVAVTFKLIDGQIVEGVRMMDGSLDAHWGQGGPGHDLSGPGACSGMRRPY